MLSEFTIIIIIIVVVLLLLLLYMLQLSHIENIMYSFETVE